MCQSKPAEQPILMSGPLVRATLEGRKTQTRRISPRWRKFGPGTRLWVKETWFAPAAFDELKPSQIPIGTPIRYVADVSEHSLAEYKVRPAMFMPRYFARLRLELTALRFEPLQRIDDAGARLEGFADRTAFEATWCRLNGAQSWQDNPEVAVLTYAVISRSPPAAKAP